MPYSRKSALRSSVKSNGSKEENETLAGQEETKQSNRQSNRPAPYQNSPRQSSTLYQKTYNPPNTRYRRRTHPEPETEAVNDEPSEVKETSEVRKDEEIKELPSSANCEVQTMTPDVKDQNEEGTQEDVSSQKMEEENVTTPASNDDQERDVNEPMNPSGLLIERREKREKKHKRGSKLSSVIRQRKLNLRLSRVLAPKNAMNLLFQMKPGCNVLISQVPSTASTAHFSTKIEHNGEILGTGFGPSKSESKAMAAEKAIKAIISKVMSKKPGDIFDNQQEMDVDTKTNVDNDIPLAGLASFALFKLFTEWQSEDPNMNILLTKDKHKTEIGKSHTEKELPPNAAELHPTTVLNLMRPGLTAVELHRECEPQSRVVMGFEVDGKMYTGTGSNKKDAKKEAAKSAVSSLWGVAFA